MFFENPFQLNLFKKNENIDFIKNKDKFEERNDLLREGDDVTFLDVHEDTELLLSFNNKFFNIVQGDIYYNKDLKVFYIARFFVSNNSFHSINFLKITEMTIDNKQSLDFVTNIEDKCYISLNKIIFDYLDLIGNIYYDKNIHKTIGNSLGLKYDIFFKRLYNHFSLDLNLNVLYNNDKYTMMKAKQFDLKKEYLFSKISDWTPRLYHVFRNNNGNMIQHLYFGLIYIQKMNNKKTLNIVSLDNLCNPLIYSKTNEYISSSNNKEKVTNLINIINKDKDIILNPLSNAQKNIYEEKILYFL